MAKRSSQRRRTRPMPPELVTFMAAVHGDGPIGRATASAFEFPDLKVPPPLALTTDEDGWYRLTVVDPITSKATAGYVRREWAQDQTLSLLGVKRWGFDLRRRG
jgi:hypothetical protein